VLEQAVKVTMVVINLIQHLLLLVVVAQAQ
jgi:hypothetical protein